MSTPPRCRAALLAAVAVLPLVVVAVSEPGAAATTTAARSAGHATTHATTQAVVSHAVVPNKYHPFSDPTYYPLRVEANLDCVRSNPGCLNGHSFWGIDETPTMQWKYGPSQAKVYAMGAGIMHIKDAHGPKCGVTNSFGTEVWIDHGGEVLSRYGHLSHILVHAGQYVTAGQAIGVVGDTGKRSNCGRVNYTDYNVKHRGYLGTGVEIKTLRVCAANKTAVSYPRAVTRYSTWNQVHQGTTIKKPAGGGTCLPTKAPATAGAATGQSVKRAGSGALTLRWTKPAAKYRVTTVQVELGMYHSGVRRYDYPWTQKYGSAKTTASSYTFRGLIKGNIYRLRVEFHNAGGWSRYASYVVKSAG